jgi:hypothetical protein
MPQELIVNDRRALAQPDPAPALPAGPVTPMHMLQVAVSQGADLQKLEQLMALQQRWEANEARKAFDAATAAFKANPPAIVKNKLVDFATSKGRTTYRHATHDEVTNKITAALAPHGLSHRWDVEQADNGAIRVTCILTHAAGHSERVSMHASRDDSGNKNSIQQLGSAVTYLQRYTLLAVTGLTTADMRDVDDDGRGAGISSHSGAPAQAPEIPSDAKLAITEAGDWDEISNVWRGLTEPTRQLILKHHRDWWEGQKARAKGEQQ